MSNIIRNIREEFHNVRQALEEHLTAINENTTEIQSLFDYLQEMEVKMEKLAQRMDQMQLSMGVQVPKPEICPLVETEKKVFLTLYTEGAPLSYREIAQKSELSVSVIPECVSSLVNKGVPLSRSFCNEQIFIKLDNSFKEMQAKENIVNLSLQSFM